MDGFGARWWDGLDRRVRATLDRTLDGHEVSNFAFVRSGIRKPLPPKGGPFRCRISR
jgi:hypothetical protein